MEGLDNKNAEDYALLALLESFGIQFEGMKAMFVSRSIRKHAEKAMELDPLNPRGYYVYGSNDYYTPEKYGGGKKAETYLKKAVSLPAQTLENTYLPSWGVEEAYDLLIKLYIKREEWDKAKNSFSKAMDQYPDSYYLKEIAPQLVGR